MFPKPVKNFNNPSGIYKKTEGKKEYGISNLKFICNSKLLEISLIKKEIGQFLNKSEENNNLRFEEKKLLAYLTKKLSEKFYLNFIDLDYKSFQSLHC